MKKERGITLIALVITIIVLLILAAVSIATLTGESGILGRASDSSVETRGSSVQEQVDLWNNDKTAHKYAGGEASETLEHLLNRLVSDKLLTEEEKTTVEETGEVQIGKRTIVFGKETTTLLPAVDTENNDTTYLTEMTVNGQALKGWKYFCTEGDKVILIYEELFPVAALTVTGDTIRTSGTTGVFSNSNAGDFLNYLSGSGDYTNVWDNIRTEVCKTIKSNGLSITEDDIIVQGGATPVQFDEAYDLRYPDDNLEITYMSEALNPGYQYRIKGTSSYSDDLYLSSFASASNPILFPCDYWLNGMNAQSNRLCYVISDSAKLTYMWAVTSDCGIRPTISLPSSLFETN